MKHLNFILWVIGITLIGSIQLQAQLFTYSGAAFPIPDASCPTTSNVDITVAGVGNIGATLNLENVCVDITHTWDADVDLSLLAPDGTVVALAANVGGDGDNFTGTCFNMMGADGLIEDGIAPFTGSFIPQGNLDDVNNGQNADGVWSLVVCDDAGGDTGTINSWSLEFVVPPSDDVGVVRIVGGSSCDLTAMEMITVEVENFGLNAQSNFPISYMVNGGGMVTESFTATLNPGTTMMYTFAGTADLSTVGAYNIASFTSLPSDAMASNDTSMLLINQYPLISSFPIVEDFETWNLCGNTDPCGFDCSAAVANDFLQDNMDADDWRVNIGGTPSTGTGPLIDHDPGTATGQYLFIEASGCAAANSILISPCMDISGLVNPYVEFYTHMFGINMGTFNLDVTTDGGLTWTNIWTQTGAIQAADIDPWQQVEASLIAYSGVIQLRWEAIAGAGFESDISLDAIRIYDRPATDVATISIDSPNSGCSLTATETVTVTIQNLSGVPVSSIDIQSQINGGGFASVGTYAGPLAPGATDVFTFTEDFSALGVYNLDVMVVFPGDGDASNDLVSKTIEKIAPITTFPFSENFETFAFCGNNFDPCPFDCSAAVTNNWTQDIGDTDDWRVNSGNTPSGPGTGPSMDNNPGTDTTKYLFKEASSPCDGSTARIISPCMDLTTLSNPFVDFYYHLNGADIGTLDFEISTDDGATWTNLWTLSGAQQTVSTDPWELASISLTGYTGIVKVSWLATTVVGFSGDIALDDVRVYDRPPIDVRASAILAPNDGCGLSATETVTVVIESLSSSPVSNIPVYYQINGGTPVMETFTGTINPGLTTNFAFATGADLSMAGQYQIEAWTSLGTDGDITNDTTSRVVTSIETVNTFPYNMGWEAGPMSWTTEGTNSSWALGAPTGAVINSAGEGMSSFVTNLTGPYNASELSYLVSPCFDFSAVPTDPDISFALWTETEVGFDEAWLEVSIDGGTTWTKVGASGTGTNWYNDAANEWWNDATGGWVNAENVLAGVAGVADVRLRFVFSSDGSVQQEGVGIDDFEIKLPLAFDAELAGGQEYTLIPYRQADVALNSTIVNAGLSALGPIDVTFDIVDGTMTSVFSGTDNIASLAPGMSISTSPTTAFVPPAPGVYFMDITVTEANDLDLTNNTITGIPIIITQTEFARDNNDLSAGTSLGIGTGGDDNAELGQNFEVVATDVLSSVKFQLVIPPAGDSVYANVYSTNPDGSPDAIIASTEGYIITTDDETNGVLLDLPINGGPITLTPGTYFLGVVEPGENISLATLENIFTPGTGWVTWDANPNGAGVWSNNEDFGFNLTYFLRAIFEPCGTTPFTLGTVATDETLDGLDDGMIDLTTTGGIAPFTYTWSNGATSEDVTGLADGMYTVVVSDILGCTDSITAEVLMGCTILNLTTDVDDESAADLDDGSIDLMIGSGTSPFTYLWDNGATTEDLTGLADGTYCVTVTDASNCEGIICATVLPGCGPLGLSSTLLEESSPGAMDGAIDLTITQGTAPYTFIWDNGATTEDLTGLSTGQYCVTVSDFYGCEDQLCEIIVITSIQQIEGLKALNLYPNPTSDQTVLSMSLDQSKAIQIELQDILGRTVWSKSLGVQSVVEYRLDTKDLVAGTYFIRVWANDQFETIPLVVSK